MCLFNMFRVNNKTVLKSGISLRQSDHRLKLPDCDSVVIVTVLIFTSDFNIILPKELSTLLTYLRLDLSAH